MESKKLILNTLYWHSLKKVCMGSSRRTKRMMIHGYCTLSVLEYRSVYIFALTLNKFALEIFPAENCYYSKIKSCAQIISNVVETSEELKVYLLLKDSQ
jgi:hypothetical protein